MTTYAPIQVITYNRIGHLKQTITALQRNYLARKSELFIFSDAPKPGDEISVAKVREYIHTVDGFKKVHIVERRENDRVLNGRCGMEALLDEYGRLIFMEDDIVTAPGFLDFMNQGLSFYGDDERILSLSGYTPPLGLDRFYTPDVFLLQRFCSWGFGTWRQKFAPFTYELEKHGIDTFLSDRSEIREFQRNGEDLIYKLMRVKDGKLDALDIKLMYHEYRYNKFTLYPKISLVQNIGHDGTGLHCNKTDKFDTDLWDKSRFVFVPGIETDPKVVRQNYRFRKLAIKEKVVMFLKRIKIFPFIKRIKDTPVVRNLKNRIKALVK